MKNQSIPNERGEIFSDIFGSQLVAINRHGLDIALNGTIADT